MQSLWKNQSEESLTNVAMALILSQPCPMPVVNSEKDGGRLFLARTIDE